MENKTIIVLFFVIILVSFTACQGSSKKQMTENTQPGDITNSLSNVTNVENDLNIEEIEDTDTDLLEIENI